MISNPARVALPARGYQRLVTAGILSLISFVPAVARAQTGPVATPPATVVQDNDTGNGQKWARSGGRTITYTISNFSTYTALTWGVPVGTVPGIAFDGAITTSTSEQLSYDQATSDPNNGIARFLGLATNPFPSPHNVSTRLTITVTNGANTPVPITYSDSHLSVGVDLFANAVSTLTVNLKVEANNGSAWAPLLDYYDGLVKTPGSAPTLAGPVISDLSVAFFYSTTTAVNTTDQAVSEIATDTDTLITNTTDLQTSVGSLGTSVGTLNTNVGTLTTNLGALTTNVNGLGTNLTTLSGSVNNGFSSVSSNLAALTGQVAAGFTGVNSGFTALGNNLASNVTSLTNDVNGVGVNVTSLTNNVNTGFTGVNGGLTTLGNNLGTLGNNVNTGFLSVSSDVGNLTGQVSAGFTGVNNAVSTLNTNFATGVGSLTAGLGALATNVNGVGANVTTLTGNVSNGFTSVSSTLATLLGQVSAGFTGVNTGFTNLGNNLTSNVGTLTSSLSALSASVASNFTTVNNNLTSIAGQLTTLSGQIPSDLTTLQGDLATVTQNLAALQGDVHKMLSTLAVSATRENSLTSKPPVWLLQVSYQGQLVNGTLATAVAIIPASGSGKNAVPTTTQDISSLVSVTAVAPGLVEITLGSVPSGAQFFQFSMQYAPNTNTLASGSVITQ